MSNLSLQALNIGHRFGENELLRGVDLTIESGSAVAIIGPNGVGKTTLMRILAGLLKPQNGEILLQGRPLSRLPRRVIAQEIAVVPQASPQVFDFTALELVLMGFHARSRRFGLPSEAERDQAYAAMERLEIGNLKDRRASVLSGGELQRVLMARAIVSMAPIWLLDEPTASLDLKHQIALLDNVQDHCAIGGAAIAILHDLSLVHRYFDHVLVLSEGSVAARGNPDDVLTPALVSKVFDTAMSRGIVKGHTVWVAGN